MDDDFVHVLIMYGILRKITILHEKCSSPN
jgi:hypothetical protein